jgi:hypothetical protein
MAKEKELEGQSNYAICGGTDRARENDSSGISAMRGNDKGIEEGDFAPANAFSDLVWDLDPPSTHR